MFIGRERELAQLKDLWRRPAASLVTVRGRRRIGKSTLIEEFARRNRVRFILKTAVEFPSGTTKNAKIRRDEGNAESRLSD